MVRGVNVIKGKDNRFMAQRSEIKLREADQILRDNGFVRDRVKGSHHHYIKDGRTVVVNLRINRMVWKRICKENGIEY